MMLALFTHGELELCSWTSYIERAICSPACWQIGSVLVIHQVSFGNDEILENFETMSMVQFSACSATNLKCSLYLVSFNILFEQPLGGKTILNLLNVYSLKYNSFRMHSRVHWPIIYANKLLVCSKFHCLKISNLCCTLTCHLGYLHHINNQKKPLAVALGELQCWRHSSSSILCRPNIQIVCGSDVCIQHWNKSVNAGKVVVENASQAETGH